MGFQIENNVLQKYTGEQTEVVVPDGIVSIAGSAFYMRARNISKIDLPDALESIGGHVFEKMPIKEVVIPDNVKEIGYCAFDDCPELETVSLPASAKMHLPTFRDCPKLKTIIFRGENVALDTYPIKNCRALNRVITTEKGMMILQKYMPAKVKYFTAEGVQILTPEQKKEAEKKSVLKKAAASAVKASACDIDILNGIDKNVSVIILPAGLSAIPAEAFKDCTALEKIVFTEEIKTVEARAFSGCTALKQVVLSDRLESIAASAFQKCKAITTVVGSANAIKSAKAAMSDSIDYLTIPKAKTDFEKEIFPEIERTVPLYDLLIWAGETKCKIKYAENGKSAPDILLTYIRYIYATQVKELPDCNKDNYGLMTVQLERSDLADRIAGVLEYESMMDAIKRYVPEFCFTYRNHSFKYKTDKKSVFAGEPLVALVKKARNMANGDTDATVYDSCEVSNQPMDVIPYVRYATAEELSALEESYGIWSDSSLFNAARGSKNARMQLSAAAKTGRQSVVFARSAMKLNENYQAQSEIDAGSFTFKLEL